MLYPSINELRKKVDSRYTLCILAAKRSRDLIDGKPLLTSHIPSPRPVSMAAQELSEDLISYKSAEQVYVERAEAEKAKAEAAEPEADAAEVIEEAAEEDTETEE
ncbi:MAG: DNA-directed RNA polymerase subunit omega [Eubacteriales bacterium]|nr:DNA-directed RNA polymerase subunit omega [Eubacteriales bacterium]